MSVLGGIPAVDGEVYHSNDTTTASSITQTDDRVNEKTGAELEEEIGDMMRHITRQSTHFAASEAGNPFFEKDTEATWHPDSSSFRVKDWIRAMVSAQSRDPARFIRRVAGVAFKNLRVHGFGSPSDYQKDVGNLLPSLAGLATDLLGNKKQKVQILHGFDGLVRNGEMLIVLGRPGR